jgi:CelD/BcsL family acetyltransferase involved in cellulose biosynthesis
VLRGEVIATIGGTARREVGTPGGATTRTVVRERGELDGLREEWDRLAQTDRSVGLFRSHAWHRSWFEHVAPDAVPQVVTFRDGGGELVGLAPLCRWVYSDRWLRLPALCMSGREQVSGDFLDVLFSPGAEECVLDQLEEHLDTHFGRGGLLVLGECPWGSPTERRVLRWAAARGFASHRQQIRNCPFIELPETFEAYLGGLSKKLRKSIRRGMKHLEEEFHCDVERLRGAEVAPRLGELVRLHKLRWEREGQTGNFARPGMAAFVEAFVRDPGPAAPELYLMLADGVAVAALLVFRWLDASLFYMGGWDPGFAGAAHSPSQALVVRSIADAIEDGLKSYEFLQGDEEYKLRFASSTRRTSTILVGRGLRPRLYLAAMRAKEWIKRRLGIR